ncbi:pentatricopeptide repeat-containing protein At5g65560-like [Arabidopsis lyrata subsp. lyrata]|uniref:pentatricopeptide repeat-containing protein At5g65560-like n=1 Tax=Arabidopsis lyrata subsp. lyrata TaxID=81972 RepID=UPI000A29E545|nr:pentatricopeptide repeat-containing protein At5g65560-like [Arabidopsis lyrata subsp. lyrata]|eukprot:XP_020875673.1 pentatricopeptide repeat-containing protein At5g65560-like [Arabidopsis lyrata subsp. lyrata]
MKITAAATAVFRRPISSIPYEIELNPFDLEHLRALNSSGLRKRKHEGKSKNRSVVKERWQGNFYLEYFLSYITTSDVSFLELDPNFEHSISCYASVLNALTKHGIPFHLHKAVTSMAGKCGSVQESLFVVDFWKQLSERIDEAVSLFARMKDDDGLHPTTYTYNALIKGFCKKNVHRAMRLLHEMRELNLVPNLVTYNLLVLGQCRSGNLDTAYRLLALMEQSGDLNNRAYGCIIDSLCKSKRVEEAHALFDSLGKKDKANVVLYNSLIDGYCKAGKLDDARLLFEIMEGYCSPDSYTFTALIHGICIDGDLKEALSLVEKMVKMGIQLTACTRTILIRKMLKEGDFDEAHRCFRQMSSSGQKPDAQTYNSFVEAYCSAGRVQEAEGMMANMKEDGVTPDVFSYTLLIKAYGDLGMTCSAFDVLKRMYDATCDPSHQTFLALIKHLFEKKYAAGRGGETALELGDAPGTIKWEMVDFDIIVQLFEKMVDHGCTPDENSYEKLILGMCKVENLGIAQRLFDQMEKRGMAPSEMVSNALLCCFCKLQKHEEAAKLVEDMICSGQSPELEYCKMVILRLYEGGGKERGRSVFQKLLRCGYYDDEIAWKILIDGMLKQGHIDAFSELFQAMQKNGCHFSPQTYLSLTKGLRCKTDPIVAITSSAGCV